MAWEVALDESVSKSAQPQTPPLLSRLIIILSEPPDSIVSVFIYTPLRIITSRHPSSKTEAKRCTFCLPISTLPMYPPPLCLVTLPNRHIPSRCPCFRCHASWLTSKKSGIGRLKLAGYSNDLSYRVLRGVIIMICLIAGRKQRGSAIACPYAWPAVCS